MTVNWIETIAPDSAPSYSVEETDGVAAENVADGHRETLNFTKTLFPPEWNIWRRFSKSYGIFLSLQCRSYPLTEGASLAEGPTHFPLWAPETSGPGSPSRTILFEQLPNKCHSTQQNQHRQAQSGQELSIIHALPNTHTHYLNLVSASYLTAITKFIVWFFFLQCILIPWPVCVRSACLSSELLMQERSLILPFSTFSTNPITQWGRDCPSVNGKRILREIVVGNNKTTCQVDIQSIMVQQSDSLEIHYYLYFLVATLFYTPRVIYLIVTALWISHMFWLITLLTW